MVAEETSARFAPGNGKQHRRALHETEPPSSRFDVPGSERRETFARRSGSGTFAHRE